MNAPQSSEQVWRCQRCSGGNQSTRAPELCWSCDRAHVVAILLVRAGHVSHYDSGRAVFDAVLQGCAEYEGAHGDDIPY